MIGQGQYSARPLRAAWWSGRLPDRNSSREARNRRARIGATAAAVALIGGLLVTSAGGIGVQAGPVGAGFTVSAADLSYILDQIKIGEPHVVNTTTETGPCGALLGNGPRPDPQPAAGVRHPHR